jgi:8-oxo-dGTP pyrophosphatase MutT (NUDIX family)
MNKKVYYKDRFIEFQPLAAASADAPKELLKRVIEGPGNVITAEKGFDVFRQYLMDKYHYIRAAGGLIRNADRYLFIFRHGKWDLPKGKMEPAEAPEVCAVRECEEECGVSGLEITGQLPFTYHLYEYRGSLALKQTYWYTMRTAYEGKLHPQTEESITAAEWLSVKDISVKVFENTYATIADLLIHIPGLEKPSR